MGVAVRLPLLPKDACLARWGPCLCSSLSPLSLAATHMPFLDSCPPPSNPGALFVVLGLRNFEGSSFTETFIHLLLLPRNVSSSPLPPVGIFSLRIP
jgi:hypothetical protein